MFGLKKILSSLVPVPLSGKINVFVDENGLLKSKDENGNIGTPGGTVPLSNTCYVNTGLSVNDLTGKIFKSYSEALSWIIANGNPAADNLWQIIAPAGNIGDITISNKYIRLVGAGNTIIENLYSSIDYSPGEFKLFSLDNIVIKNISINTDKFVSCYNCLIYNVSAADADTAYFYAENCFVLGGDFMYIECGFNYWLNNFFISFINEIENLHGTFNNCTFKCVDYAKKITFLAIEEETNIFNFCNIDELNITKDFVEAIEFQFNKSIVDYISLVNNITFNLFQCTSEECSFDDETDSCLNLYSSDVKSFIGSGKIITDGYSFYKVKIGDIDYEDFNASPSQYIAVNFPDAIPNGAYIEDIFFVVKERFRTSYGGYTGLVINHIEHADLSVINNTVDAVVNCKPNNRTQNNSDITIISTLSGANTQDWTQGSFEVWCHFKSIPTL